MMLAVVRLFAMCGRAEILVEGSWLSALAEAQRRMGFKHGTALLVSTELRSPISWGVLRPTIVLRPTAVAAASRSEEHTSELQSLMRRSYAVFCLKTRSRFAMWTSHTCIGTSSGKVVECG